MKLPALIVGAAAVIAFSLSGCANSPGRPRPGDIQINPADISDFDTLYKQNCAGCHGTDGKGGAALALADPVYLAIADDAVLHQAATNGIPGTSMPAFAQSAGGMLTDKQIAILVNGIRVRWARPGTLQGTNPPPYASVAPSDSSRGADVYAAYCSSCHGAGGRGGAKASSIVNGSFLALLNDQELRTLVIVGRPELGAPDWRSNIPGKPMSSQEISDVVAWLASQRPKFPGQPFPSNTKPAGETR
ncbi:MAG TPA: c-type cytochrome [Candidatus Acidoferrales bacterium]